MSDVHLLESISKCIMYMYAAVGCHITVLLLGENHRFFIMVLDVSWPFFPPISCVGGG